MHCHRDAGFDSIALRDWISLSFVHVDGGSNLDSDGFPTINADALSFFQVSFSVTAPIVFNLSFFDSRGYITGVGSTYDQTIDFSSDISGSIVHVGDNGQSEIVF